MNIFGTLRSAFAKNRRRNVTATTAAALVVAGAVGTATAVTLTIDLPRTYESLVELNVTRLANQSSSLFNVHAGKKLILTDIVLANPSPTVAAFVRLYSSDNCNNVINPKLTGVVVPTQDTVDISLATGLYFEPGHVCVSTTGDIHVTATGYLFK
jgi:hypothetical protein